jgi:hypothetical protein
MISQAQHLRNVKVHINVRSCDSRLGDWRRFVTLAGLNSCDGNSKQLRLFPKNLNFF